MSAEYLYPGQELALFEHAINWKKYFSSLVTPLLKGRVLEMGAGIGATTLLLNDGTTREWLLVEPDSTMCEALREKVNNAVLPSNCIVKEGTIKTLDPSELFDAIIYIDVLEHIENDREELDNAAMHLRPGGHVIVLAPAFQSLFSPFDKAIGHYRRYDKNMLKKLTPISLVLRRCHYLDTVGYFASLANKALLRKSYPTKQQVLMWDRLMVPVSRITDRLFFYSFGKSILAVWKKPTL